MIFIQIPAQHAQWKHTSAASHRNYYLYSSISDHITGSESRIADQNGRYHELAYTNTELE